MGLVQHTVFRVHPCLLQHPDIVLSLLPQGIPLGQQHQGGAKSSQTGETWGSVRWAWVQYSEAKASMTSWSISAAKWGFSLG